MTDSDAELVKRLQARQEVSCSGQFDAGEWVPDALCQEAAAAITRLAAEKEAAEEGEHYASGVADLAMRHRDIAESSLTTALAKVAALEADNARLREWSTSGPRTGKRMLAWVPSEGHYQERDAGAGLQYIVSWARGHDGDGFWMADGLGRVKPTYFQQLTTPYDLPALPDLAGAGMEAVNVLAKARHTAFGILQRHGDCLQDDVVMNDLIEDIAAAIQARSVQARAEGRAEGIEAAAKLVDAVAWDWGDTRLVGYSHEKANSGEYLAAAIRSL